MLQKWLEKMEQKMGGEKKKNTFRWILLLGCLGIGIMILASFIQVEEEDGKPRGLSAPSFQNNTRQPSSNKEMGMVDYEKKYEAQLADVLSKIVGVDDVSVMVNLDSTEEEVVHVETRESSQITNEADPKGGNRTIQQTNSEKKTATYRGEDGEQPMVVKRLKPKIRGVLVVARGVEDLQVKAAVIEAIQRTLDVPIHRISVLPKG
ncbi:stage III sporulation protein AG [Thermoflavimicrobium dichotomicum]|uniref:Stage III sporulation protein AG n=1 Tax=Thermoflavimicrobium dichotomicum TaxID=46223 RepID=A0A1I3QD60_9BACL|nr:stage III sporulation protein AG [Thermoflavimicrobium dichotomicum]SFJ31281.1 stage III sporulation protein AG [Thermoflavimicrobium dichotomicum]